MTRLSRLAACAVAAVLAAPVPAAAADAPASGEAPWRWSLPPGFPEPWVPPDNPMSRAKVALGERLFFDTRLSVTGQYSCASCHEPARAFTDGRPVSVGALGDALPRNAMTLANVAWSPALGWG